MHWKPSPCLKNVVGKHVLIVGGSSGIGLTITKELLSHRPLIILLAKFFVKLEKAQDELLDNKTIYVDRTYTKKNDVGDYDTLQDA